MALFSRKGRSVIGSGHSSRSGFRNQRCTSTVTGPGVTGTGHFVEATVYLSCHTGARFSKKALSPSSASWVGISSLR